MSKQQELEKANKYLEQCQKWTNSVKDWIDFMGNGAYIQALNMEWEAQVAVCKLEYEVSHRLMNRSTTMRRM